MKASLQNEIDVLRFIDHPNLIKLDSVYENENSFFMIFELFEGGNLRDYIEERGIMTEMQASLLIKLILEGVKYLHSKNIMHRDIKPENILFRSSNIFDKNQIVLADFGLATFNHVPKYVHGNCGTPGFIAPEIFFFSHENDHYGLKCDLFSVGVTLFYILTGEMPFPGKRHLQTENRKCLFDFSKMSKLSKTGFFYFETKF